MSLWKHWKLIRTLTLAQIRARYRKAFAGFLWVILSPIIMFGAQSIVFKHVIQIKLPNYGGFLLGGLLPWIFIINSLEMGVPSLIRARQLLLAFKIEPAVLLGSSILDNWVNFMAAFLLVLVPNLILNHQLSAGLFFLPLATLTLLVGVTGLVAFLAMLNVFYRDIAFLVHFIVGVFFFLTPIAYPREFIPKDYQWAVAINPIFHMIQAVRECIYGYSPSRIFPALLKSALVAVCFLTLATAYWKKRRNEFYHYL